MTEAYNVVAAAALAYVSTNSNPTRAGFVASVACLEGLSVAYVNMVVGVLVSV